MKRRDYLVSTVGVIATAGCSSEEDRYITPSGGDSGGNKEQDSTGADLQVSSLNVSSQNVELGKSVRFSAEVANNGGSKGKGELWFVISDTRSASQYWSGSSLVDLEDGKSTTVEKTVPMDEVNRFDVKTDPRRTTGIRNTDESVSFRVTPKELQIGGSFKNADGYRLRAESVELRESYQAKSMITGDVETKRPETHDLFAFAKVWVKNADAGDATPPTADSFFSRVNGEIYEEGINPAMRKPEFRGDLSGISLYEGGDIPSGSSRSGYLVFEVPVEARDDYQLGWDSRYSPNQVVYWRK